MGEYCRTNLDWDWDATRCLQRLFNKMKRPKESPHLEGGAKQGVSIADLTATTHLSAPGNGTIRGTLVVTIPDMPIEVEKVRIRVESEAGEVRYKTFYTRPSAVMRNLGLPRCQCSLNHQSRRLVSELRN